MSEPTQARCDVCRKPKWEYSGPARNPETHCAAGFGWCPDDHMAEHWRLGFERLAAEAAPLREEIERLTKEVAQSDALLSGREQLRAAAVAMVLSLEKKLAEALAAASRAREEQGALRAALAALKKWADSPEVNGAFGMAAVHGYRVPEAFSRWAVDVGSQADRALAPPAAESQENQQQLTGKGK